MIANWVRAMGLAMLLAGSAAAQNRERGVFYQDIQAYLGQRAEGVEILGYEAKSTVERMGLKQLDIVQGINGQPIRSVQEFRTALFNSPVPITSVTVLRGGRQHTLRVRPLPPGAGHPDMGEGGPRVRIEEIGADVRFSRQGMRIQQVHGGSVLPSLGIQAGDVVTAVNDRPLRSEREFEDQLFRSRDCFGTLTVFRPVDNQSSVIKVRRTILAVGGNIPQMGGNYQPPAPQPQPPAGGPANPWLNWVNGFAPPVSVGQETTIMELGIRAIVESDGLRISGMDDQCLARELGMERGDIILRVNNARVLSQGQFANAVYSARNPLIEIVGARRNRRFFGVIRREVDRFVVERRIGN